MRRDPKSTEIDNPMLADGVRLRDRPIEDVYRVPQDIVLEQRHGAQLSDFKSLNREGSQDNKQSREALPGAKSGRKGNIYGSNTDLSLSSNSKAHGTMKRQWKAPADNVREASQFEGI